MVDTAITPDGPTRYDFILEFDSYDYPIDIFVELYDDAQYLVQIYNLEQRRVIEEFLYERNKYFSKSDFSPEEDVNYLVHIEFMEGSGYVPFSIYTDYSLDPVRSPKGTTIKGSLSHEDLTYDRDTTQTDTHSIWQVVLFTK